LGYRCDIDVIIKFEVSAGHQEKQLVPLILKLRVMALNQPGYIYGQITGHEDLSDFGEGW
jgi:hypothetical protein